MARPRSEDKRNAPMAAATRVIVIHGLRAPTALIAQEAGVFNGSLFTYFETKTDLFKSALSRTESRHGVCCLGGASTGPRCYT
ncbi:MAG: TetR family transcriptional regulator, partial [Terriglobales bacterium]